ncbi:MAG: hypothetical protein ACRDPY_12450, partial [Streptosporangiaceae bacterium]
MHPEIAKTLVAQRHDELTHTAENSQGARGSSRPSWFSRHFPRWHVSWSRTVLSPAGAPGAAGSGRPGTPAKGG